jgi:hypothetical protein
MDSPDVNLLLIAARIAHEGCGYPVPASPVSTKVLSKAEKLEVRVLLLRDLALELSEAEQRVLETIHKIQVLHKLEPKMSPCKWRELMEALVESLKYWKNRHREQELLLRRMILEPDNDKLLKEVLANRGINITIAQVDGTVDTEASNTSALVA